MAAEVRLATVPTKAAAFLRKDENTVSYPQGVNPSFTTTEVDGVVLHVTR